LLVVVEVWPEVLKVCELGSEIQAFLGLVDEAEWLRASCHAFSDGSVADALEASFAAKPG
jgi:hypothetical protein